MSEFFNWQYVIDYFPKIVKVLPVTLELVLGATIIGTLLGLLIALARIEKIPVLSQFSVLFVSFIRCTPELVQLFLVYYGIPLILQSLFNIDVSTWDKIIFVYITFGLNAAGFFSEIFRSAIESIPRSQFDAGLSIGMNKWRIYRRFILPQSIRVLLPSYGTMLVGLLQSTSIAFTLGIIDVIGKAQTLGAMTYHTIEGYFVAAILFVVLSFVIEGLFWLIDKQFDFDKTKSSLKQVSTKDATLQTETADLLNKTTLAKSKII